MLRLLYILCTALLLCQPLTAQNSKKVRSMQKQQATLKQDIANQEKMLRSTKKDVKSQLANLQIIGAQIEGQEKYVAGIHAELTELGGNIADLERQLKLLENDLNDCKRKYHKAVNYMYRNRTQLSKWQFVLSAKNFRQMYRRMRYMTAFSKYQRAQGRIIEQKERLVRAKRSELLGVKADKDKLMAHGEAEKKKLQGQQKERQDVVNALNQKQKQLQSSIAQQKKKYSQLNAQIEKTIQAEIAAAERRRKAELERQRKAEAARQAKIEAQRKAEAQKKKKTAASTKKGKGKQTALASSSKSRKENASHEDSYTTTPNFSAADNADRALSGSFAANKGRLPIPLTGPYAITAHYGVYNVQGLKGVQLENKGINIAGHSGAQARAVFRGEVTAVFPSGGVYNVIVRHGSYMTVYCNLASIAVRQGQQVSARQNLGTVAADASGNCTLQFQLWKERSRLNPEGWLAR